MRITLFFVLFIPCIAVAQTSTHGFYANAKAGVSNVFEDDGGVALSLEGGLVRKKNLYSGSYFRSEEFLGRDVINAVDFTIGRYEQKKYFVFHYQAGLSTVWGKRERGADDVFTTIGLPVKTGIKFAPPNFFSLGIDLQANINSVNTFYAIMFTLGVWPSQHAE